MCILQVSVNSLKRSMQWNLSWVPQNILGWSCQGNKGCNSEKHLGVLSWWLNSTEFIRYYNIGSCHGNKIQQMVNEELSWAIAAGGSVKRVWARTPSKNVNSLQVLAFFLMWGVLFCLYPSDKKSKWCFSTKMAAALSKLLTDKLLYSWVHCGCYKSQLLE